MTSSDKKPYQTQIRCHLVEEVIELYKKLNNGEFINVESYQLNVIVTVLKEILRSLPNSLFGTLTSEMCELSLDSSLHITIIYLHSILCDLSPDVRLFAHSLCKALKNLTRLTDGDYVDVYTDMLLHFTPILFPNTLGDVQFFLRATRLLLVMIDYPDKVFYENTIICDSNSEQNIDDEEIFYTSIIKSLQSLEATLTCEDSGVESDPEESLSPTSLSDSRCSKWSTDYEGSCLSLDLNVNSNNSNSSNFYNFTYIDPDDQLTPTDQ